MSASTAIAIDESGDRSEARDITHLIGTLSRELRRVPVVSSATTRLVTLTIADIADALDLEPPVFDPRDPVPVEFLRRVARSSGVGDETAGVAEIGRAIVESAGGTWKPEFESPSNSVTGAGLRAIKEAVGIPMPPDDRITTV